MNIRDFCSAHEVDSIIWIDDDHFSLASSSIDNLVISLGSQFAETNTSVQRKIKKIFIIILIFYILILILSLILILIKLFKSFKIFFI